MYKIYIYKFSLFKEKRTRLNKIQGEKKHDYRTAINPRPCCGERVKRGSNVFHDTSTNNCFFSLITIYGLIPNILLCVHTTKSGYAADHAFFFSLFLFRGRKLSRFGFGRWEISESSYRPSISLILFLNDNYAS